MFSNRGGNESEIKVICLDIDGGEEGWKNLYGGNESIVQTFSFI